MESKC